MSLPPQVLLGVLPQSTIVPTDPDLFIPYLTRLYERIAQTVNRKDAIYFPIAISDTAENIPSLPNFGSFIVSVSGVDSTLPTKNWSLCKADETAVGQVDILGFQDGTGAWGGNTLTVTSTATNFQIAHDRTGVTGNFSIRIIGTQGNV